MAYLLVLRTEQVLVKAYNAYFPYKYLNLYCEASKNYKVKELKCEAKH